MLACYRLINDGIYMIYIDFPKNFYADVAQYAQRALTFVVILSTDKLGLYMQTLAPLFSSLDLRRVAFRFTDAEAALRFRFPSRLRLMARALLIFHWMTHYWYWERAPGLIFAKVE